MEQIRDRVLDNWRLAKRAESKERIAEGIDRFIAELTMSPTMPQSAMPHVTSNTPSRTDYEELKKRMLDAQVGLMGEIRKRDEQIAVLAEAIAGLSSEPAQAQTWKEKAASFLEGVKWHG